jgi:hypothetical protein
MPWVHAAGACSDIILNTAPGPWVHAVGACSDVILNTARLREASPADASFKRGCASLQPLTVCGCNVRVPSVSSHFEVTWLTAHTISSISPRNSVSSDLVRFNKAACAYITSPDDHEVAASHPLHTLHTRTLNTPSLRSQCYSEPP